MPRWTYENLQRDEIGAEKLRQFAKGIAGLKGAAPKEMTKAAKDVVGMLPKKGKISDQLDAGIAQLAEELRKVQKDNPRAFGALKQGLGFAEGLESIGVEELAEELEPDSSSSKNKDELRYEVEEAEDIDLNETLNIGDILRQRKEKEEIKPTLLQIQEGQSKIIDKIKELSEEEREAKLKKPDYNFVNAMREILDGRGKLGGPSSYRFMSAKTAGQFIKEKTLNELYDLAARQDNGKAMEAAFRDFLQKNPDKVNRNDLDPFYRKSLGENVVEAEEAKVEEVKQPEPEPKAEEPKEEEPKAEEPKAEQPRAQQAPMRDITAKARVEELQAQLKASRDAAEKQRLAAEIIATREAVNAQRGGAGLENKLTVDVSARTAELAKQMRQVYASDPRGFDKLVSQATSGHGGKMLEGYRDARRKYVAEQEKLPEGLGERDLPTAKERIEALQKQLPEDLRHDGLNPRSARVMAEIVATREAVNAQRGGKNLKNQLQDSTRINQRAEELELHFQALLHEPRTFFEVLSLAKAGHGGDMREAFNTDLGVQETIRKNLPKLEREKESKLLDAEIEKAYKSVPAEEGPEQDKSLAGLVYLSTRKLDLDAPNAKHMSLQHFRQSVIAPEKQEAAAKSIIESKAFRQFKADLKPDVIEKLRQGETKALLDTFNAAAKTVYEPLNRSIEAMKKQSRLDKLTEDRIAKNEKFIRRLAEMDQKNFSEEEKRNTLEYIQRHPETSAAAKEASKLGDLKIELPEPQAQKQQPQKHEPEKAPQGPVV